MLCTGGEELSGNGYAVQFVREAFKHGKTIGALPDGEPLLHPPPCPAAKA
ncbi:hypothetical protein [Microbispora sp. CA-102843]